MTHEKVASGMEDGRKAFSSYVVHEEPELGTLNSFLRCVFMDQSSFWRACLSWLIFFIFTVAIPVLSNFALSCPTCDANHQRPYHVEVEISLSVFAIISFVALGRWSRKFGLKKFLFLEKFNDAGPKVQSGFRKQLQKSTKLMIFLVIPCLMAEMAYKIWWYVSGANEVPYYGNIYASYIISCALELCSWSYRTSLFFYVCVLCRLVCFLQILRLEDFSQFFHQQAKEGFILIEHLRIRRNLRIISHRFRLIIVLFLLFVTVSQICSLIMTLRSADDFNILKAGQITVWSISMLSGLFICLHCAAKITHKAQSVTALSAKWHACATLNAFDAQDNDSSMAEIGAAQVFPATAYWESEEGEGEGEEDEDMDDEKLLMPIYTHTVSFQKRQALVTYFENNRAGITVFGFMVDRAWLHSIFAIELAITLWTLNKTIGKLLQTQGASAGFMVYGAPALNSC